MNSAVGKHITAIKNKGFLVRHGDTRGYWEINLEKS
jgi:biotin operon repressor